MTLVKMFAAALIMLFALNFSTSQACDKSKTASNKSSCSTEMKTTSNTESCDVNKASMKTVSNESAKSSCCSGAKTVSSKKDGCCSDASKCTSKKNTKLEAKKTTTTTNVKTVAEVPSK